MCALCCISGWLGTGSLPTGSGCRSRRQTAGGLTQSCHYQRVWVWWSSGRSPGLCSRKRAAWVVGERSGTLQKRWGEIPSVTPSGLCDTSHSLGGGCSPLSLGNYQHFPVSMLMHVAMGFLYFPLQAMVQNIFIFMWEDFTLFWPCPSFVLETYVTILSSLQVLASNAHQHGKDASDCIWDFARTHHPYKWHGCYRNIRMRKGAASGGTQ